LVEFALAAETASCLAIEDSNTDAFILHHPEAKYFNV